MGMGCFQPNQGCVVYADEWAQVHRSFALVLLSPGFPGPAVPSPAMGGPSNADPGSCTVLNRIGCRDYRSPVSPSQWPLNMTPAPLRASLGQGRANIPVPMTGPPSLLLASAPASTSKTLKWDT